MPPSRNCWRPRQTASRNSSASVITGFDGYPDAMRRADPGDSPDHCRKGLRQGRGAARWQLYRNDQTFRAMAEALPSVTPPVRPRRIAVLHGGLAPGMNTAARAAVRLGRDRGHVMLGYAAFAGLVDGRIKELTWGGDVEGWTALGGAEAGPAGKYRPPNNSTPWPVRWKHTTSTLCWSSAAGKAYQAYIGWTASGSAIQPSRSRWFACRHHR